MKNFRGLKVWQKGYALALDVYRSTRTYPKEELYGLTGQTRRAAMSVPANIAEGCCRDGDAEFARFLYIAMGSASELECHLLLGRDLGFLDGVKSKRLLEEVAETKRMLSALIRKLKADR
jgi:four helix bundle protein